MDYDFGNRLKELRRQSGMTQKQLAEKIGITKSVISFYELRKRGMPHCAAFPFCPL